MFFISSSLRSKTSCCHSNGWVISTNWVCEEIAYFKSTQLYIYFRMWLHWYNTRHVFFMKLSSYSLIQEWFWGQRYIWTRALKNIQHGKGKFRTLLLLLSTFSITSLNILYKMSFFSTQLEDDFVGIQSTYTMLYNQIQ